MSGQAHLSHDHVAGGCGHDHAAPGHDHSHGIADNPRYRWILWIALLANAAMFAIEIVAGLAAHSVSLQADALDFLGDAANYAVSLFVLGLALRWRARASLLKALSMGLFAAWVLGRTGINLMQGTLPEAATMGVVGAVALFANLAVALLLFRFREGDSNMRSVWLCTRNDALGNIAVLAAAGGVFGLSAGWPDLIVAAGMATLAAVASVQIGRLALRELRVPA